MDEKKNRSDRIVKKKRNLLFIFQFGLGGERKVRINVFSNSFLLGSIPC